MVLHIDRSKFWLNERGRREGEGGRGRGASVEAEDATLPNGWSDGQSKKIASIKEIILSLKRRQIVFFFFFPLLPLLLSLFIS